MGGVGYPTGGQTAANLLEVLAGRCHFRLGDRHPGLSALRVMPSQSLHDLAQPDMGLPVSLDLID